MPGEGEIDLEQLIREEDMVISITHTGYVKRLALSAYRQQKRGGVGVMAMEAKDDDWIEHLLVASTHDYVLFFTTVGKVYRLKVHELPEGSAPGARPRARATCCRCARARRCAPIIATRDFSEGEYLMQATRNGVVKKTLFKEYDTPLRPTASSRSTSARATSSSPRGSPRGERRHPARLARAARRCASTSRGAAMGRATGGVAGMRLRKGDEVIAIEVARDESDLLVVTENGYGKRTTRRGVPAQGARHDGRAHDPAASRRAARSPARWSSATTSR